MVDLDSHASLPAEESRSLWQRLGGWATRVGLARKCAIGLAAAAIVSGVLTYLALSGVAPFGAEPQNVLILLNIDLVLLLLLGAVVAFRLVRLWLERRRGSAGSRLHTRIVGLFSFVAVTPTILVAVFSALFLDFGLQTWFSESVSTALDKSLAVSRAYVSEHRKGIRADALALAVDLNRQSPYLLQNPVVMSQLVGRLAELRSLTEAVVLARNGRIVARSSLSFSLEFDRIPEPAMQSAAEGEVVVIASETDDRVRALIRLDNFPDAYLYVGRFIESSVLNHVRQVEGAVGNYKRLETRRSGIQITFVLIFVVVALLVLLASIWVGLYLANRVAKPVGGLIAATERVRSGDLSVRVSEIDTGDEIGALNRAFNRMTGQLAGQQQELLEANQQLDERRRFTEAVLAGVTAGVIGVDERGRITLPNPSALKLLNVKADALVGRPLEVAIPEMAGLLDAARARPQRLVQEQIELARVGHRRILLVRIVAERTGSVIDGFVVTFDDISALVSAQRTAAWADVARRIAHEIKNPLTPIQLAAERLKRRYLKEITTEPEIFSACTDTIVRQVGDIRQMVDEFSAFARLPAPTKKPEDLRAIVQEAFLMQRVAYPNIAYDLTMPEHPAVAACDARQISQSLTNLLKNAAEAIDARPEPAEGTLPKGKIGIMIDDAGGQWQITVEDNGRGLPDEHRERLTEPYVTTRKHGTGLGLAIVHRIMGDHGGELHLSDGPEGGARVTLSFSASSDEQDLDLQNDGDG